MRESQNSNSNLNWTDTSFTNIMPPSLTKVLESKAWE